MSVSAIHAALRTQLDTLGYPVAWENVPYEPEEGQAYLRESFAPNRTREASLGTTGYNRVPGVYLVDVFTPVGRGVADGETIAAAVLAAYTRGSTLTNDGTAVTIERSYRAAARADGAWWHVPCTVEWRADIAP